MPVKIAGAHAGISVGPDGATHQALEDIALMRVLPRMVVVVPCDAIEAEKATIAIPLLLTAAICIVTDLALMQAVLSCIAPLILLLMRL